ncbi:Ig-like domain-containing protein [Methanobrevibacter sp.]|uniref:Ig-like domain-containing protein n=1 Tax=Methanobrevibacter sp. TaxID=66852 RepID=UPI0026DF49DF|nr:Ig-like domain-containing protein [Methanobrevibacter sp.]
MNLTDIVYDSNKSTLTAKFNFFVYDSDNDNIIEYDFNNLWLFDLTLSSQNLTHNKNTVSTGETFTGNVDYYKGKLVAQYEDVTYTMPFKFQTETWIEANSTINIILNKNKVIDEWVHPFEMDYMPFLISKQRIKYVSSNSSIVKVDSKGKITGLKVGVANITITFNGYDVMGNDKYKPSNITITVNVTRIPTEIKPVFIPEIVYVGFQGQFVCSMNPSRSLTYTCNDTSVADVGHGYIKGIKEGTVNITVSYDGDEKYAPSSYSVILVVSKRNSTVTITPAENITVDVASIYFIGVSSTPSGVELIYKSSNPDVATVEEDGRITGVSGGLANITVSFEGNDKYLPSSAQIQVKVISYETHFDINSTLYANVTDSFLLNVPLKDYENRTIIPYPIYMNYTSNDTSVVEIDSSGYVTCMGEGKATINISFAGQNKYLPTSATITVIVSVVPTKIKVEDTIELHVDERANINATLNYGNSADLKYSSNNISVVSVDRHGNLVAHKVGIAEITVTYPGTKKFVNSTAKVIVNVTKVPTKIDVGKTFSLIVGDNELLNATLNPESAGSLTYSSSNESVVTIDANGMVTAVAEGKATITVSYEGTIKYASSNETVEISIYKDAIPTSIEVNGTITLYANNKTDIGAVLTPSNAGKLIYTSNDTDVATVDENGIITAVGEGTALIHIQLEKASSKLQDNDANVVVNVLIVPTNITASESVTLNLTENAALEYSFSHPEAGALEFIIANPNIVNIENGLIIGKAVGNTTITINFNGNRQYAASSAIVNVNVVDVPVSIDVDDAINLNITETADIGAKLDPAVAGSLVYSSSNSSVVIVDENGVITAKKVGEVDIVVSFAGNGKYRANSTKVHVTVSDVPVSIIVADGVSVNVTETADIGAKLDPAVAGSLVYSSSNSSVVIVDENGVITAKKVGEVDIVVSFAGNGKYRANSTKVHVIVVDVKTEIEIENTTILLVIDDNVNINATLNPSEAGKLKYDSNNSDIVSVDENGMLTAIKEGEAIITVSYDGEGKYVSSNRTVTVKVSRIPTEILINRNITLELGTGYNIKPQLNPSNAGVLSYSSSNVEIVEVDNKGFTFAIEPGKANLTIRYAGNERYLPSEVVIEVTVSSRHTSIEVDDNITIGYGDTMNLGAKLNSGYVSENGELIYESSNPSIVSIDENGVITANNRGSAVITIKYEGLISPLGFVINEPSNATVNVFVTTETTKITLGNDKISLKVDDSADIDATLNRPKDGILTYTSSNDAVATVDANGRITAVGEGVATIIVFYAGDDNYHNSSANVTVTVSKISSKIKVNISRNLKVDEVIDLGAILQPVNSTLTYTSSNNAVATVDAEGRVTGHKSGNAIITVKFAGDNKYASSQKSVSVFVSRISTSINVDPIELYIDDTYKFENIITPADAGDLEYISSDTEIVDVDIDGIINTYREGTAEIFINYTGNYKYLPTNATVVVTVLKKEIPATDYKFGISVRDDLGKAIFSIKLPQDMVGSFTIIVDDEDIYTKNIENGAASITVDDLNVGKHKVTMRYGGNQVYSSITEKDEFTLSKIKIDKNKNVDVYYGATAKYTVHLTKNTKALQGVKVTFTVNGKKLYAKTDTRGYATIKVKLPKAKSYKITASYGRFKVSNKINVHLIVAKNVAVKKSSKSAKIIVSLKKVNKKYLSGKKVTLKFNGKTLKAKTNKKGVATFTLNKSVYSKLKVGKKYTYKVIYSTDTVSKKITIKK